MKATFLGSVAAKVWSLLTIGAVITLLHPSNGQAQSNQHFLVFEIAGKGTVAATPDQVTHEHGTSVTLTATPAPGYRFAGWGPVGDPHFGNGTENPLTLVLDSDLIVIANFEIDGYELAVGVEGNGHVTRDDERPAYLHGTSVTLTAVPNPGYVFIGWKGSVQTAQNPLSIVMDGDQSVTAVFAGIASAQSVQIAGFAIGPVGPIPSVGPVHIGYSLPKGARVRLGIVDVTGRSVASLVSGWVDGGRHSVTWNGRSESGAVAPGTYYVDFQALGARMVRKVTIVQ